MKARAIMVMGTASGVGKSFLVAGLCRLFSNQGLRVAPFKAQNMSNNSFVTLEGGEMGRAQVVQAECARVHPQVDMNPILLKPTTDQGSQVVLHGKPWGDFSARDYFKQRQTLWKAVQESYHRLADEYDVIVIEGAGSPAEVNLKEHDLVNMKTAEMAEAQCLLVADIDRGGVFASVIGTLDLLEPQERDRFVGIVINKFRGDPSLFEDGIEFLEKKTKKPVMGVLPFDRTIQVDEEDTLDIVRGVPADSNTLDVAVILLERMSNFTDFEILKREPIQLRYIRDPHDFGDPDLVILPGTKSTAADLLNLRERGLEGTLQEYVARGGRLMGVCGGFQMLGKSLEDLQGHEGQIKKIDGFGYFDMQTQFQLEKTLKQLSQEITFRAFGQSVTGRLEGYEIHRGQSNLKDLVVTHPEGKVFGTYVHGFFDQASLRHAFLQALAKSCGKSFQPSELRSIVEIRDENYNRLAELIDKHLERTSAVEFLKEIRYATLHEAGLSDHCSRKSR